MLTCSLMLLSAFGYSALAGKAELRKGGSGVSPRQLEECTKPGWIPVCPGDYTCIPASGTCCTDGYYHLPGETCPDGTTEVPRIDQSNPPSASITPAPSASSIPDPTVVDYTWYTYEYTYSMEYYYYYYFDATYEITSTETTYYTIFSFTATDDVAASSVVESFTSAFVEAAPTQSETPTIGPVPASTATSEPAATSKATPSSARVITSSRVSTSSEDATPTVQGTSSRASLTPFTGAAASFRTGSIAVSGSVFGFTLGAFVLAPGMLMLLL